VYVIVLLDPLPPNTIIGHFFDCVITILPQIHSIKHAVGMSCIFHSGRTEDCEVLSEILLQALLFCWGRLHYECGLS
jgi:hypothetical protein